MDAIEEIRNASSLVDDDANVALADLFGDQGPTVKAALVKDMGAQTAAKFTIGICVGAQLVQSRIERERAAEEGETG